jgi:Heavy metal associated domain 2
MVYPIHHVPGRLRIKILQIKGRPEEATRFAARIESMRGVRAVAANAVTGSVVIHYDPRTTGHYAILAVLQADVSSRSVATPARKPQVQRTLLKPAAEKLGHRLARSIIETLLERSAMALIAGLV